MEVGVIYQRESIIDENNNFNITFKNEEEIVELLFRKNRDFYLANAVAFVRNKFDKDITELEKSAISAPTSYPYDEIEIDYTKPNLLYKRLEIYKYKAETTSKNYLKNIKYFDTESETIKEKKIYDIIERLEDGITYNSTVTSSDEMYTKIEFKLTDARKIEIRLTDSVNDGIRFYYYFWMNCVFRRYIGNWTFPKIFWLSEAQKIYKKKLAEKGQRAANVKTTEYIWKYLESHPDSELIEHEKNYKKRTDKQNFSFILFRENAVNRWDIDFAKPIKPYSIYISTQSKWYLNRNKNIMRHFPLHSITKLKYNQRIDASPVYEIARFIVNTRKNVLNEDYTECLYIHENFRLEKKINNEGILDTDYFYGREKDKRLSDDEYNNLSTNKYKISDNDFKDLNKTIKPSEFAFFLYDNLNIIKETYVSELQKKVSLIGGVWDYVNAGSKGKIELISPKNKLKFNVK